MWYEPGLLVPMMVVGESISMQSRNSCESDPPMRTAVLYEMLMFHQPLNRQAVISSLFDSEPRTCFHRLNPRSCSLEVHRTPPLGLSMKVDPELPWIPRPPNSTS